VSRLGKLRKWDLTPIGAVLVVILLGGLTYLWFVTAGPPSTETLVRRYYASPRGGGVPKDVVRRINVTTCQATGQSVGDNLIFTCALTLDGETVQGCFALSEDKVVAGSAELGEEVGCTRLVWGPRTRKFISMPMQQEGP
jgi:hypothetical protein